MSRSNYETRPYYVADRLDAAADLIEKRGWYSTMIGHARNPDALPVDEALAIVSKYGYPLHTFRAYLDTKYDREAYLPYPFLIGWNDSQTDRRKVCRHLRRAAQLVRDHKMPVATY